MFHIETLINGRWVRISTKARSWERVCNNVAYLVEDCGNPDADDDYRIVPA